MKDKLEQILKNPNRRYGVYPIIHRRILNDELIEENDDNGYAGVVANIEYRRGFDSDDTVWKETAKNIRKYIDRGMYIWLYDEDGYPSGVASGYLTEKYPEYIAKELYCYEYWRTIKGPIQFRSDVPDDKLWRAILVSTDGEKVIDVTDTLNENNVLYFDVPEGEFRFMMLSIRRLFDGVHTSESYSMPRNYIHLFDKEAVGRFIEMTHEKYKKHLSDEFGRGILATFTDEPSLVAWCLTGSKKSDIYPRLVWHEDLPEKFYDRYGYDFLDACVAVLKGNVKGATKKRCDYWEFIADGVAEGYFKQIQDWCHANNLKSSGHCLGEEMLSVHVLGYGSFLRSIKHLDWPGIDMLYTTPEELMNEEELPIGRLVASSADISGENEVFTEYSDHYLRFLKGQPAELKMYYCSTNWHFALGVNNFTSYYGFIGITPEEKREFNKYVSRCGEIMRMGVRDSRTALLYPETDMWSNFNVSSEYAHTCKAGGEKFVEIHEDYCKLSWGLLKRQVDFDYVLSELLINGEIKDGVLKYNSRRYTDVILSTFTVVEDRTAKRIIELVNNGVRVHLLKGKCEISRETGEKSPYADEFLKLIKDGKIHAVDNGDIDELLDNEFNGGIIKTQKLQKNLMTHCRKTEDGTRIIFAANMDYEPICDTIMISENCSKLYKVDVRTGTVTEIPFAKNPNGTSFALEVDGLKANIYVMEQ